MKKMTARTLLARVEARRAAEGVIPPPTRKQVATVLDVMKPGWRGNAPRAR